LVRRRAAEAELFIGGAGMPQPPRSEVDRPAGKKLQRSTTTLAAILSALAGMASTVLGTVKQAKIIFGGHSTLILLTIVALATLWIIRERYLKARDEGV